MRSSPVQAKDSARGFDCNQPLSGKEATLMVAAGYEFILRYVGRVEERPGDLSMTETGLLIDAGLCIMAVQHVESETDWLPTANKGAYWGANAVRFAWHAGILPGTALWCDLEGVDPSATTDAVRGYCAAWHAEVFAAGYQPGLYVGWHCGLSPQELYQLSFQHYWGAYNLDEDQYPAVRGIQMKQHARLPRDVPAGIGFEFDVDTISSDALGGLPTWMAP